MRDRLDRGKLKHNGEWVYWNLFGQIVCLMAVKGDAE